MKVLVIGSGGREHALVWQLAKAPKVTEIFCAPGNAGIASLAKCVDIKVNELDKLATFAEDNCVDLTVVGPEDPLCSGIVDVFKKKNLKIFGPDKIAAQLEGSKHFAKEFMLKYNIPTAKSETFTAEKEAAEYIKNEFLCGAKAIVIKADGLAAGKGVLVAENVEDALAFLSGCFSGIFGDAGATVVIEECLYGEEASILALTDGKTIVPLVSSQDHKRIFDNDQGPNTGGMGAYSPAPVVNDLVFDRVKSEILDRFLAGIQAENFDFKGVIFVGIMIENDVPKVLEFNVRFGDPEIQAVLRRFEGDFFDVLCKTAEGNLAQAELNWSKDFAVSVIMASGGYPGKYSKNYPITGLEEAEKSGAVVFHAGTSLNQANEIVNTGGRVLGVSAKGENVVEALKNAYSAVEKINFKDCFYRKDIGKKAIK